MNDNEERRAARLSQTNDETMWAKELQALRDIAARGVAKPESLTADEIKEMSWAFLLAAGTLTEVAPKTW